LGARRPQQQGRNQRGSAMSVHDVIQRLLYRSVADTSS
jgi:hypothetical protein